MNWVEVSKELRGLLRLKDDPVAYRKLDDRSDLAKMKDVFRVPYLCSFCQVLFMARTLGMAVGVTKEDNVMVRCQMIHGVQASTEESKREEAGMLSATWFKDPEDAYQQQLDQYRVPPGKAIVVAPLEMAQFEPEVILIFGNPAQLMMLMCGMQKEKYERFEFCFSGEGACGDSLARCYVTGKVSLAIPCYGERAMGQVANDELVIALPPKEIDRAISGLKTLSTTALGFRYPIAFAGGILSPDPILKMVYPSAKA
ncbi:MAG: DUF169 domain-containing protein [Candidatus Methanomethyliaceae archaeon]